MRLPQQRIGLGARGGEDRVAFLRAVGGDQVEQRLCLTIDGHGDASVLPFRFAGLEVGDRCIRIAVDPLAGTGPRAG